ncbi:diguanylate cyclase (GGDEF)-like protein [Desulfobotulus alkaliphilus]|uniref:Diguanylate cyclase (GGDEF)-like protein n=1 Tax=Desulfobotulus alkaliphilus TaxID=622671 RepID=A0A562RVI0_9BACT|nr:EAL domain-containing protein [Desulfobotulus alkaliphilus]TWI73085.1 diguanylate cyclase (GGDEF)-like protein [Desulfobotulus alkaliphilus]
MSDASPSDHDPLTFLDESDPEKQASLSYWSVLIADDEPDVHQVTLLALKDMEVEGRRLKFFHAYSGEEARTLLMQEKDIAVILLDVVMETEDAGLRLVHAIRKELKNTCLRIILRTGQPGYAPEIDTILRYDINDYKTKAELTRTRLFTSMTSAIRAFHQIQQLEISRHCLGMILDATTRWEPAQGLTHFAQDVITEICAMLSIPVSGLVCTMEGETPVILAGAGPHAAFTGKKLSHIDDRRIRDSIEETLRLRQHQLTNGLCLYLHDPQTRAMAVFVDKTLPTEKLQLQLIDILCQHILTGFEKARLYQKIRQTAFEDPLLGIPNRARFLMEIDKGHTESGMLALLDIDGFADINSILDQNFGDTVLQAVSQRLKKNFSEKVFIARISSDVFGLLGPEKEVHSDRIREVFLPPFLIGEESLRLSATSSLIPLPDNSLSAATILKNAGVSLKQAKRFNRGKVVFYDPKHVTAARDRMQMLSQLRQAFTSERLFLMYQPIVNLKTGRITAAEALLRWRNDNGDFIPPDRFIPLAEQSGLMVAIGEWVMRTAFRFLKSLSAIASQDFRIAINVSQTQFREPDFAPKLFQAMEDCGVEPSRVEIELTESVAIDSLERIKPTLGAVCQAGVSIAMDDFGTGYSSLSVLHQLHINRLKIDRAFVSGPGCRLDSQGIAATVLQLAEKLSLQTIGEGIEEESQRKALLEMGCTEGQGYLFSRPVAAEAFEKLLKKQM